MKPFHFQFGFNFFLIISRSKKTEGCQIVTPDPNHSPDLVLNNLQGLKKKDVDTFLKDSDILKIVPKDAPETLSAMTTPSE